MEKSMRFRISLTLVAFLFGATSLAASDESKPQKIMVVNLQEALNKVEQFAKAKEEMQQELEKNQKALNAKRAQLEKAHAALNDSNAPLSPAARKKKETDFKVLYENTQKEFDAMRQNLAAREQKTLADIVKKMKGVVKDVAAEKGYSIALDGAAVLWSKSADDQTSAVVEAFEEAYPVVKTSKKKGN
jgi:outer membrane protein